MTETRHIEDEWLEVRMDEAQPHPPLAAARATCPIPRSAPIGLDVRPRLNVTLFDDVDAVLRDPATFSSAVCMETLEPFTGPTMLGKDGAEHRRIRMLVAKAFQPRAFERWERDLIRPIIAALVADVAPRGRADLVSEVFAKFPIAVICGMYGVPLEDAEKFHVWADEIIRGVYDPETGFAARDAMTAYLRPIVEDRRARPTDDLLSDLLAADVSGERLSEEELWGTLILILVGGTDTTYLALGSMIAGLLAHPDVLTAVRGDRSLIPAVVEEALRWEGPAGRAERTALRAVTLHGREIPAGSSVNVWLNSANHDERRFPSADEIRLDRPRESHVAFGAGPHICLGQHLARLELQIGLDAILDGLPNLRLDPSFPPPVIEGTLLRGPKELHVVFDAAGA